MNRNFPKVSVIIPTYNRPHLIGRAIQSILNQTYQNFEIVVIDDSPNDETEKVVKKFGDARIKYIHNKIRSNLPKARNQGVRESSSDSKYIAFLDDDDEYLPQFLKKVIEVFEKEHNIDVIITNAQVMDEEDKAISKLFYNSNSREFWRQEVGNGCIIRKKIFIDEDFWYDERKVIEDLDFGIRVLKDHCWKFLPEILRTYRLSSCKYATPSLEEMRLFYKKNYSFYSNLGRKALSFFHFYLGKGFLALGAKKEARENLFKAFLCYPNPKYILVYFISLFLPNRYEKIMKFRARLYNISQGKL